MIKDIIMVKPGRGKKKKEGGREQGTNHRECQNRKRMKKKEKWGKKKTESK